MKTIEITQIANRKDLITEITNSFSEIWVVKEVEEINLNSMKCIVNYYWANDRDDWYEEKFKIVAI